MSETIITFKRLGESGDSSSGAGRASLDGTGGYTVDDSSFSSSTSNALAAFAAKQLVVSVINEATAWGMYEWDKNLALNDDYIGQRTKRIAVEQISKAAGMAGTVFNMAASGAMIGGPWGAVIGAALGVTQVASSTIRENLIGQEQQNISLAQMEASLNYTRRRVGWSSVAASIGEDL